MEAMKKVPKPDLHLVHTRLSLLALLFLFLFLSAGADCHTAGDDYAA